MFVTPLVIAYALFIRWCDRFEPEPWWLLVCAFVWGAFFPLVVFGATLLMVLMERYPIIITLGAAVLGWTAGEMGVTL